MADVVSRRPVQTYSREAERISEQIARPGSDPELVDKLVNVMRVQADEISNFLISRSSKSGRYTQKKNSNK